MNMGVVIAITPHFTDEAEEFSELSVVTHLLNGEARTQNQELVSFHCTLQTPAQIRNLLETFEAFLCLYR